VFTDFYNSFFKIGLKPIKNDASKSDFFIICFTNFY